MRARKSWPCARLSIRRRTMSSVKWHAFSGRNSSVLDSLANNQQYDYLEKRVPDYATITDRVAEWVDTQPRYLKEAFTGVMQSGTPG